MKLSVIIVNYNVRYFLEQALHSAVKASSGMDVEIFVVDNNSVDDSIQMVREKFPTVQLIDNKDNVGFAKANNQAIRKSKGEYILLLNPDTVVEEDTFINCVNFMDKHPEAGALGVKMIDGSGKFLPESKRGLPSPWVAFTKAFGLSKLFPKSKIFNKYHLGYLSKEETHEVDILAGAFMMLRKSVLDKIGLLDEAFFMYGEDIDLSYRILKAGYKNYYFAGTTIIHYKGESTKKGSLNYVRTFYDAMIIFAKKHFTGEKATIYVAIMQFAVYFRAFLTVVNSFFKRIRLPVIDFGVIYAGMYFLKNYWANYHFNTPDYYPQKFMYFYVPIYIIFWLSGVFFSGGYDESNNLRRLFRRLFLGTLALAAVYGFLPMDYRTSRALILLGALWSMFATFGIRAIAHFIRYGDLTVGREKLKNLIIAGSQKESERVLEMMNKLQVNSNFIGIVSPEESGDPNVFLCNLSQLDEVVHIYKIDEIIFCSLDINSQDIMKWMSKLGHEIHYKIVPKESWSIIGSSSKNTAGELYTVDIQFNISTRMAKRNKRILDAGISVLAMIFSPLLILFMKNKLGFVKNIFCVLFGKKTWVGYKPLNKNLSLPKTKPGILSPISHLKLKNINEQNTHRLNFLYAKDYSIWKDFEIILKSFRSMGSG